MKSRDADILVIPGLGGSGPDHWQTRWQARLSAARRVEQADWDQPVKTDWCARITEAIAEAERPVILLAHSLGVIAAAHVLSAPETGQVAGAFLVAPPEEDVLASLSDIDAGFRPYPRAVLPCPAMLVASRNDPYGDYEAVAGMATRWGASVLDAGEAGHINSESGHGPWPEGLMAFAGFLARL